MNEWKDRFQFYGENTSINGISYVANGNYYILERLCWLIVVIISMYGMILIFLASYDAYDTNPISFVTETTYLNWNTTFPSVSICQVMNQDIYWTAEPNAPYSALQTFISEVVFFTGSCYACSKQCNECARINMSDIVKKYRKPCSAVLGKCKWFNNTFDCCEKFLPVNTEYGVCFSINSMHTSPGKIWMKSNRLTGPGVLTIQALDDVRVFFHAPEDIPFINADPDKRDDVMLGERYIKQFNVMHNIDSIGDFCEGFVQKIPELIFLNFILTRNALLIVIEIDNDEELRQLPVHKRGCRFPDEPPDDLKAHKLYSYSTCVVQCHVDAQMKFCNCTHHLMPNMPPKQHCNIQGLKCLTENYEILNRLHSKGFNKPGLECDCVPSCVEPEYKVVLKQNGVSGVQSEIVMKLQDLPTQRFKRNVVRSTLDLVVSIGGTAGLFFGASLLSIIETFYLLLIRK